MMGFNWSCVIMWFSSDFVCFVVFLDLKGQRQRTYFILTG